MRLAIGTHLLTVILAGSYLTLGIFDSDEARKLWAPYAVLILLLALWNMRSEHHADR